MKIVERAKEERKFVKKELAAAKKEYNGMPNGRLECYRRGNGWRWVEVKSDKDNKVNRKWLSSKDYPLARRLAHKRRLKMKIDYLENHLEALNTFIESDNPEKVFTVRDRRHNENPEIIRLDNEYFKYKNPSIANFSDDPLVKSDFRPEGLKFQSKTGRWVRSKSEGFWDAALSDHKIPYQFEPKLWLDDPCKPTGQRLIRPDFAAWSFKKNRIIYIEHFGMMSDEGYRTETIEKLGLYLSNGYLPMENLITTFEQTDNNLSALWIETLIEYFFE